MSPAVRRGFPYCSLSIILMTTFSESQILLAVIGLVGLLGTAVTVSYAIAQNRREELKLQRRLATYRFDQDLLE